MSPSEDWLRRMLRQNETSKVDFKEKILLSTKEQKIEFAKDVCTIANTSGGKGYLVVGVRDKPRPREVVGADPTELAEERLQQIISVHCDPPVKFTVDTRRCDSKKVVLIEIPRSLNRPHQVKDTGAFYIRRGSTTDKASTSEVIAMALQRVEIERRGGNEYDQYGIHARREAIQEDTFQALKDMGFSRGWIRMRSNGGIWDVAFADARIGSIPIRVYLFFDSRGLDKFGIYRMHSLIKDGWEDMFDRGRFDQRKAHIFISLMAGSASKSLIEQQVYGSLSTVMALTPSIIYSGLGRGQINFDEKGRDFPYHFPKFFVQKVRSKDDIGIRLTVITDWLRDNIDVLRSLVKLQKNGIRQMIDK